MNCIWNQTFKKQKFKPEEAGTQFGYADSNCGALHKFGQWLKDDNNKNFTLSDLPKNRGLHRFVFSSNLNPPLGWKTDCIHHQSKKQEAIKIQFEIFICQQQGLILK